MYTINTALMKNDDTALLVRWEKCVEEEERIGDKDLTQRSEKKMSVIKKLKNSTVNILWVDKKICIRDKLRVECSCPLETGFNFCFMLCFTI